MIKNNEYKGCWKNTSYIWWIQYVLWDNFPWLHNPKKFNSYFWKCFHETILYIRFL